MTRRDVMTLDIDPNGPEATIDGKRYVIVAGRGNHYTALAGNHENALRER